MRKVKKKAIELVPMVKICYLTNGWLIEYPHPNEDCDLQEAIVKDEQVMDDGLSDCKALQQLLWMVREGIGEFYSKHNKYNVEIVIKETETDKEVE